ncbi:MAG: hypothetical protein ACPLTR_12465 [Thermacetogeniaceae bacterium]
MIKRIEKRIAEIEEKIAELQERKRALEEKKQILEGLTEVCPTCKGTGREDFLNPAGDSDTWDCRTCRGLGKVGPIECAGCGHTVTTDMVYTRRQADPRCPWCGTPLGGQYELF